MEIEKLPKNILECIFSKLSNQDVLNLSLVCKKFSKIINNSNIILNTFELLITDFEIREWIGTRKYQKIYIEDCREDRLLEHEKVFKSINDSVTEIAIRGLYEVDLENFHIFMDKFINITKLTIFSLELYYTNSPSCSPLNLKFLKYLTFCQSDVKLLKLFENCQLIFFKVSDDYGGKEVLKEFLVKQENLEILELSYFDGSSKIFDDEQILQIKFKLRKLAIDEEKIGSLVIDNLVKFLDLHKESLEYFEVYEGNYEIIEHLKDFENLKNLRIFGGSDTIEINLPPMVHIETLYLESKIDNFHSIFPNLVTLRTDTLFANFSNIDKLRKLQNLEVHNFWDIPVFLNKNIRSLKLVGCSFQNIGKFIFDGNKLESLVIKNCYFIEWLKHFLLHKDQKLNILKILNMQAEQNQLTQEIANAVNKVKHKIHTVISPCCI